MPPLIRELLTSLRQLTVGSVSQEPFVLAWGDPRGPQFFFAHASTEGFTQLPVRTGRSIDRIVDTLELEGVSDWDSAPNGRPIMVDDLVARDAPLFSLLPRLSERDLLLCLGGDGVDGVVTVYDLNQPAAHMFALGLALVIEAEMSAAITACFATQRALESYVISVLGAKNGQVKRWHRATERDQQVEILNYLTFSEKMRCLTQDALERLSVPAKTDAADLRRKLREVQLFRNSIAHYAVFELADYRSAVAHMRTAYTLARRLSRPST